MNRRQIGSHLAPLIGLLAWSAFLPTTCGLSPATMIAAT